MNNERIKKFEKLFWIFIIGSFAGYVLETIVTICQGHYEIRKEAYMDNEHFGDGSLSGREALEAIDYAGGPFNIEDGTPKFSDNSDKDTTVFDSLKNLLDTNEKQ